MGTSRRLMEKTKVALATRTGPIPETLQNLVSFKQIGRERLLT